MEMGMGMEFKSTKADYHYFCLFPFPCTNIVFADFNGS